MNGASQKGHNLPWLIPNHDKDMRWVWPVSKRRFDQVMSRHETLVDLDESTRVWSRRSWSW